MINSGDKILKTQQKHNQQLFKNKSAIYTLHMGCAETCLPDWSVHASDASFTSRYKTMPSSLNVFLILSLIAILVVLLFRTADLVPLFYFFMSACLANSCDLALA